MFAILFVFLSALQGVELPQAQQRLFGIVDRFESRAFLRRPFVKVSTGAWKQVGAAPKQNSFRYGFLLNRGSARFKVRFLDCESASFTFTPPSTPAWKRVVYERADLREYARRIAARLAESRSDANAWKHYLAPDQVFEPDAFCVLVARACWQHKHVDECQAIWKQIDVAKAALQLGRALAHALTIEGRDPQLSRADLVARHKLWLEIFPGHNAAGRVGAMAAQLEEALAQDTQLTTAGAAQAIGDPMRALVRALRDEFHTIRGMGDVRYTLPTSAKRSDRRPSARILQAGHAAVPALLEALEDETPSRSVWYVTRWGGGFSVKTVGDLANELLCEISGLELWGLEAWNDWWRSISTKGERATLLAHIKVAHAYAARDTAMRVLARWPDAILQMIKVASELEDGGKRAMLLRVLAETKAEGVTRYLRRELEHGNLFRVRIAAADALLARGMRDGLSPMKAAWIADLQARELRAELAKFLLLSGDLEAVRLVADAATAQRGVARRALLEHLRSATLEQVLAHARAHERLALGASIEAALIALLDDLTSEKGSLTGFRWRARSVSWWEPKACDFAACALASIWPERYFWDPGATSLHRARARMVMKNAWRKARGRALLELPLPLQKLAHPDIVRTFAVRSEFGPVTEELRKRVELFKQKRLDVGALVDFLVAAASSYPEGRGDIHLIVERPSDSTGTLVQCRLAKPSEAPAGMRYVLRSSAAPDGRSDGVELRSDEARKLAVLRRVYAKALAMPHAKNLEVRLHLRLRGSGQMF